MDERVPESIQPLLERYIARLRGEFPELLNSFYIVGSIALGEFNPYFSDIDFIAILNRHFAPSQIDQLQNIHREIEIGFPPWKMSGSYIQVCDLGKLEDTRRHPHYHDGKLEPCALFVPNPVTWWELKNFGVTITGMKTQNLSLDVDPEQLIAWTKNNMNTYWAGWTKRPARIMLLYSDWGIQWVVTGVLRQFYTLRENKITTKVKASRYALEHLPARWHPIIQEAINIRARQKKSVYRFKINRIIAAVYFLKFIIHTCNTEDSLK